MISFMAHDTLVSPHIKVVNTAYTNKLNSRLGAKAIELKHSSRQLILIRHSETQFYVRRDLFFLNEQVFIETICAPWNAMDIQKAWSSVFSTRTIVLK
jgi:hypothetical protein